MTKLVGVGFRAKRATCQDIHQRYRVDGILPAMVNRKKTMSDGLGFEPRRKRRRHGARWRTDQLDFDNQAFEFFRG